MPAIQKSIVHNLTTTLARQAFNLVGDDLTAYQATALTARDTLVSLDVTGEQSEGMADQADTHFVLDVYRSETGT